MRQQIVETIQEDKEQTYHMVYKEKEITTICEIQTKKRISEINFFLRLNEKIFDFTDKEQNDLIEKYKKNLFKTQIISNQKINNDCEKLGEMNVRKSIHNIKSDFLDVINRQEGYHLLQNFRKRCIGTYYDNNHIASAYLDIDSDSRIIINPSNLKNNTKQKEKIELLPKNEFLYKLHLVHVEFSNKVISSKIVKLLYLIRKIAFFSVIPISIMTGIGMMITYTAMLTQTPEIIAFEVITSLGIPGLIVKYLGKKMVIFLIKQIMKKII